MSSTSSAGRIASKETNQRESRKTTESSVLDSGLFHGLSDEDRIQFVAAIAKVLANKGKLCLQCFSDQEPAGDGPRRISEAELREVFRSGWQIHSISTTRFVVRDDADLNFSNGVPKAWFCVVERASAETDA